MLRQSKRYGQILVVAIILSLVVPMTSMGAGTAGNDWYCSEPHTHEYKKHTKQHIDKNAKIIAEKLEKIFIDHSLSTEERQVKTIEILNNYISKVKAGIGD